MRSVRWLAMTLWYGLGIYICLGSLALVLDSWEELGKKDGWMDKMNLVLPLVLVALVFILIHMVVRALIRIPDDAEVERIPVAPDAGAFPSPGTVSTGIWLLTVTFLSLAGLFLASSPNVWPVSLQLFDPPPEGVRQGLIVMFAGAAGSMITTILGYLEHASYKRDFKVAFVPWYIARPIMGMLLGLIFYFLLKGGLWVILPTGTEPPETLSSYGLAGFGALVGMFSKNAISKLREIFQGMFRSEEDMREEITNELRDQLPSEDEIIEAILERLPEDLREQAMPHLVSES